MENIALHRVVRPPVQGRSQATLNRLAHAGRELLEAKDWHEISVDELARRAQSSVGSFYARFSDKDGLLDYLDELYTRDITASFERLTGVEQSPSAERDLESLVRTLIGSLVAFHRAHRGLIRALAVRTRTRRALAFDERTSRMSALLPGMLSLLEQRRYEIHHPNPKRAVPLAFGFAFSALRDRILFPESILDPQPSSDEELTEELSRSMLAYLGVRTKRRGRPG